MAQATAKPKAAGSITLDFKFERETKNTLRFQEQNDDPDERPAIGTLYITKKALDGMGEGISSLKVTVEVSG